MGKNMCHENINILEKIVTISTRNNGDALQWKESCKKIKSVTNCKNHIEKMQMHIHTKFYS
jgi:hypothetical protein